MINNLQTLRALAALSVVFYHCQVPGFAIGSFGVDLFFVISGFILSHICWRKPQQFLLHRMIRIVPLYWFFSLAVFAIALFKPALLNFSTAEIMPLLQSLFFIPYSKSNGSITPILAVGWTLNYEMFFYCLVALCLRCVRPPFATLAASVVLALVVACLRSLETESVPGIFYSESIVFEFCLGVMAFWLWKKHTYLQGVHRAVKVLVLTCSMAMLILAEQAGRVAITERLLSLGLPAFLMVLCAVLLEPSLTLSNRLGRLIGQASYSLYLSHVFTVAFIQRILAPRFPHFPLYSFVGLMLTLSLVCAVSLLCYRWLEAPLIHFSKKWLPASDQLSTRQAS